MTGIPSEFWLITAANRSLVWDREACAFVPSQSLQIGNNEAVDMARYWFESETEVRANITELARLGVKAIGIQMVLNSMEEGK